ncbi:nucleotidyltransferase family protein [Sphingomonas lacunae]|uniref:Nucleotidyltransferase family protein n=1 Tax=Sphingomonas lacunae TaxID=2698828 RepID=A0A6M4B2K3_9SPHN|nr:nucleotidyltransferase family protein [Sphingomonas lacunae]QJQ33671.1 nucleotidyltransferase family protein [Sphingomonas lacunae]
MLLRDPAKAADVPADAWDAILSVARGEVMLGTLALRLAGQPLPSSVARHLEAAARAADHAQRLALWEAEMCRRALGPLGIAPILLKGTAYAAAGLPNAAGRQIGDLDILVPRERLDEVEAALLAADWEWVKDDPYDQAYYRRWMHELPPLIHAERDRMVDVHHTILPLTARITPDAAAMIADAQDLPLPAHFGNLHEPGDDPEIPADPSTAPLLAGYRVLGRFDIVHHCVAHLMADGEMDGGLRNLWDFHCLVLEMQRRTNGKYLKDLLSDTGRHGLRHAYARTARLAHHLFGTPMYVLARLTLTDQLFLRRLLARDDWGREIHRPLRFAFYIRSHLLRMPLPMLLRHLWIKWRKGSAV